MYKGVLECWRDDLIFLFISPFCAKQAVFKIITELGFNFPLALCSVLIIPLLQAFVSLNYECFFANSSSGWCFVFCVL